MLEKRIRQTKIEIFIISIIIVLSIPLWYKTSFNWNYSLATIINSVEKLELIRNNTSGYENIIINNNFNKTKKYQVLLITPNNCNNEFIMINDYIYQLKDLLIKSDSQNYTYLIATDSLNLQSQKYQIINNLAKKNITYYYILEELNDI